MGRPKGMGGITVKMWDEDSARLVAKFGRHEVVQWLRGLINDDLEDSGHAPLRALPDYHGTYHGYSNLRCRCVECRRAKTEKQRRQRAEKRASA